MLATKETALIPDHSPVDVIQEADHIFECIRQEKLLLSCIKAYFFFAPKKKINIFRTSILQIRINISIIFYTLTDSPKVSLYLGFH